MNDGQSTPHPEPDPAPFKVHLLTRAGRVMRARSESVRAFSNKDEAVRFAGRQLGGHYAVYHKHKSGQSLSPHGRGRSCRLDLISGRNGSRVLPGAKNRAAA